MKFKNFKVYISPSKKYNIKYFSIGLYNIYSIVTYKYTYKYTMNVIVI